MSRHISGKIPPKAYVDAVAFPHEVTLRPIGVVRSVHHERHGTPRQACVPADPALRPSERSELHLFPNVIPPQACDDLARFDTIWVITWLHLNQGWNPRVRPPGHATKHGVFATRSPHRPNPVGLSAVRLLAVDGLVLVVERTDLLDGTPIVDIKPYVPYADAFPNASNGWLHGTPLPPKG